MKEQERLRKLHELYEMEMKEVEQVKREQMKVTAQNYKHNIKVRWVCFSVACYVRKHSSLKN